MPLPRRLAQRVVLGILLAATSVGCANWNNTQKGAAVGAAGGAGLGAIIGNQFGAPGAGALIGGLAGTATGALAGNAKDEADRRDYYARQASYERAQRERAMAAYRAVTNRDVVDMVQHGVSDRVIISTIQNQGGNFDLSPQGIITMQRYGVSDYLIQAMQYYGPRY